MSDDAPAITTTTTTTTATTSSPPPPSTTPPSSPPTATPATTPAPPTSAPATEPSAPAAKPRSAQPALIRLTHWLNIPVLAVMAASGLQILVAYPYLGPRGATYDWWPLQGWVPPAWARVGQWLGGARAWHFAFAWLFVANALVYAVYLAASGEWRRRLFHPRRDARNALETVKYYARVRKTAPEQGLYNGLQRAAYTGALALALVEVLSGLAMWKPVQLAWLAAAFGGYDGARAAHLIGLLLLAGFLVGHVAMVLAHPRSLLEMITGGKPRE